MGLFGKSKKELEREEAERKFEEYYGISREEASINGSCMGQSLGTLNLDAVIKLRAAGFYSVIMETYIDNCSNKKEIEKLNQKYDKMIELLTKQNELLGVLAANSKNNSISVSR
jgi:hypothetical protein